MKIEIKSNIFSDHNAMRLHQVQEKQNYKNHNYMEYKQYTPE